MFRKIVSNLSFSPALVGQLGFYAKRLRKEEVTRKLGLIFVALALVVQSLTIFQPSESANASSSADFVYGGLGLGANKSLNNFLAPYDSNSTNLKDIMNSVGITREEIASSQFGRFWTPGKIGWGREPRAGQVGSVTVKNSSGTTVGAIYGRPLTIANGNTDIYGWIGHSSKVGWFAIMQACGNLVTDIVPPPPPPPPPPPAKCAVNQSILATDKECQPCLGNATLWYKDPQCVANIIQSKTAVNTTQSSINATTTTAKENDTIVYTITVKNTGLDKKTTQISDHLGDTLEYSTLIDRGGGTFEETTKVLSWPDVSLAPNESQVRTFAVKVLDTIPVTAQGASDPTSYDCVMGNVFGTSSTSIKVPCTTPKVIENVTSELPKTGPTENILFAGIVFALVAFFYARSRVINKEVRLIRRHLNTGTI